MVTPHLPPHQAANALLPHLIGETLRGRGHVIHYLTFGRGPAPPGVTFVRRRWKPLRPTRLPQLVEAVETWWKASRLLEACDVVHVHSSTWVNQVAARLAARRGRPYILTHYGTEVWHHDGRDEVFRRMNREAHHVTFYSQALLERARDLRMPMRAASVVYPAVADAFRPMDEAARSRTRERHASTGALLLNVKRLHHLADHATLLSALAQVIAQRSDTRLLIAGSGKQEPALRAQAARLGLERAVAFLGRVPNDEVAVLQGAADLFVLPSVLEATPTVALEALACGTPVVSTDSPGGVELHGLFGDDVAVVPRQNPPELAAAILAFLEKPRRTSEATTRLIEERFRLAGVADRYLTLYQEAAGA